MPECFASVMEDGLLRLRVGPDCSERGIADRDDPGDGAVSAQPDEHLYQDFADWSTGDLAIQDLTTGETRRLTTFLIQALGGSLKYRSSRDSLNCL